MIAETGNEMSTGMVSAPMRVACVHILNQDGRAFRSFAESCFRFSPLIAIGKNCVFIEIGKCKKIYSEKSFLVRVKVLLSRFGLEGRVRIGSSVVESRLLAIFCTANLSELPFEALNIFIDPYGLTQTDTKKLLETLGFLGIRNLGELSELANKGLGRGLTARFGKDVGVAFYYLRRAHEIPWRPFVYSEAIVEKLEIDPDRCVQSLEPLMFLARRMLDQLLLRLRARGKLLASLELTLVQEKYSTVVNSQRKMLVAFAFPQGSMLGALPMLQERLGIMLEREPLQAPIVEIQLKVADAVPGVFAQSDFFSRKEKEEEELQAVASRLVDRLGVGKVFMAVPQESYWPERSWKKKLELELGKESGEVRANSDCVASRPLRLLKAPILLKQKNEDSQTTYIAKKKAWKVVSMEGPERISGEWWLGDCERDYFRVFTENGEVLWVYVDSGSKKTFLHGVFD